MCFHHLGHRQRLVAMSYTFISFAQNSGRVFPAFSSSATRRWVFSSPLCFVDTLPYVKKHIISFKQFSQFVINKPEKKLPDYKWPSYLSWDFSADPFCFNEHCLSSLTWPGAPSSSICSMHSEVGSNFVKLFVSNDCTSIPPCAFWLNNFQNFLCTALSLDMHFALLNLIIPFILCF